MVTRFEAGSPRGSGRLLGTAEVLAADPGPAGPGPSAGLGPGECRELLMTAPTSWDSFTTAMCTGECTPGVPEYTTMGTSLMPGARVLVVVVVVDVVAAELVGAGAAGAGEGGEELEGPGSQLHLPAQAHLRTMSMSLV